MPKVQVYLPDELAARLREHRDEVNVSSVLQAALEARLDELKRHNALAEFLDEHQRDYGAFREAEVRRARQALNMPGADDGAVPGEVPA